VILVDTNVLVALVDERDHLHERAARDLHRARGKPLLTIEAVLSESCFLLVRKAARQRLRFLLHALSVRRFMLAEPWEDDVFAWLEQYSSHQPDFADAQIVIALSREPKWRAWTYDSEFRTTWRRIDGTRIPLL
jgi:predicted nucleic acid-binding protein